MNKEVELIPSGCTILDLACSDSLDGFCLVGTATNFIGSRNAGKTLLANASQAETFYRWLNHFDYKIIDTENAYSFNTAAMFGKPFADVLEVIPTPAEEEWCTERLAFKMIDWMQEKPQFFVIDSMDNLMCQAMFGDRERIEKGGKTHADPNAKANKLFFRHIIPVLGHTGSVLIYLSQGRPGMGTFAPQHRSGGEALKFHAHTEIWLSNMGQIKKIVKGVEAKVGHGVRATIGRSKINGKSRIVDFPILYSYGIDNTKSMIDWLDGMKMIKKSKSEYNLKPIGFDYVGSEPEFFIEDNGLYDDFKQKVFELWDEREKLIVERTLGERRKRYGDCELCLGTEPAKKTNKKATKKTKEEEEGPII